MPATSASAPAKIILFGEHAVVYGRPAIAVPISSVMAKVFIRPVLNAPSGYIHILSPGIELDTDLSALSDDHPLALVIHHVFSSLGVTRPPAMKIRITSTIPIASGLGSGAAVSVALARALSAFLGHPLTKEQVSAIAFEADKIYHHTPSGIDNTVITYQQPVYFIKNQPVQTFKAYEPFTIVIADTGIPCPTMETVRDVRHGWQANPGRYDKLFDSIGCIVEKAHKLIQTGHNEDLGPLMDENHQLLCALGVSSQELDRLIEIARAAGALGAKLSGGGRGGNMIALTGRLNAPTIAKALQEAGAVHTITTTIR
ncbi:MAG: mevalonate kinase [Chloroflexota bacterium]